MNIGKGYRSFVKEASRKNKRKMKRNGNLKISMFLLHTIRKISILKFNSNHVNHFNFYSANVEDMVSS